MAAEFFGFKPFKQPTLEIDFDYVVGKNSEVFHVNDLVSIPSTVGLEVAAAGEKLEGVCAKTVTMASDNQTVAQVKVPFIPWRPGQQFVASSDEALDLGDVGKYFDISGPTGAQYIVGPTGSTNAGALIVVALDPLGTGSTKAVLVEIAEPQTLAAAQV